MPDGDVIPDQPVRLWKRPHQLMCSGLDTASVGDAISHSLIRSLRDKGGLPGVGELTAVVERFATGQVALIDALAALRDVERRFLGHLHTRLAARAASRLLVELSQGDLPTAPLSRVVLERFSWELVRYQLLGRRGPDLQGTRFSTYEDRLHWERDHLDAIRPTIDRAVVSLEQDPTGKGLRVVATSAPSEPTTESMLGANLLVGTW